MAGKQSSTHKTRVSASAALSGSRGEGGRRRKTGGGDLFVLDEELLKPKRRKGKK